MHTSAAASEDERSIGLSFGKFQQFKEQEWQFICHLVLVITKYFAV